MARWWPTTYVEAKAAGSKYYRSDRPCRRGHMADRFVSTKQCSECMKERNAGLDADAERARKRELSRRRRQRPEVKAYEEGQARERWSDPVKRQKLRDYAEANREKLADRASRKRALKREVFVEEVSLEYLFTRDGGKCQLCGRMLKLTTRHPHPRSPTRDHIVPLTKGGTHERRNLQLACFRCNSKKGNKSRGEQLLIVG